MLGLLYFITPFVFLALTIILPVGTTSEHSLLSVNVGVLNGNDIRRLSEEKRLYLRKKLLLYFIGSTVTTLIVSIVFACFSSVDNTFWITPCNMIGLAVGLFIALQSLKTAKTLKIELDSSCEK